MVVANVDRNNEPLPSMGIIRGILISRPLKRKGVYESRVHITTTFIVSTCMIPTHVHACSSTKTVDARIPTFIRMLKCHNPQGIKCYTQAKFSCQTYLPP